MAPRFIQSKSCGLLRRLSPYAIGLLVATAVGGGVTTLLLQMSETNATLSDTVAKNLDTVASMLTTDPPSYRHAAHDPTTTTAAPVGVDSSSPAANTSLRMHLQRQRLTLGAPLENFVVADVFLAFSGNEWTRLAHAANMLYNLSVQNVHSQSLERRDLQYSVQVVAPTLRMQHHNAYVIIKNATHVLLFLQPHLFADQPNYIEPHVSRILLEERTAATGDDNNDLRGLSPYALRERACQSSMPYGEEFYKNLEYDIAGGRRTTLVVYSWDYVPCMSLINVPNIQKSVIVSFRGQNLYTRVLWDLPRERYSFITVFAEEDMVTCNNVDRMWNSFNQTALRYTVYTKSSSKTYVFAGRGDRLWCSAVQTRQTLKREPNWAFGPLNPSTLMFYSNALHVVERLY